MGDFQVKLKFMEYCLYKYCYCRSRNQVQIVFDGNILAAIKEIPSVSSKKVTTAMSCNSSILRTLKEQQLYPHHLERVHALLDEGFAPRVVQ